MYICVRARQGLGERARSPGRAAACSSVLGCDEFEGLAHREREFLQIWSETEERLAGV